MTTVALDWEQKFDAIRALVPYEHQAVIGCATGGLRDYARRWFVEAPYVDVKKRGSWCIEGRPCGGGELARSGRA